MNARVLGLASLLCGAAACGGGGGAVVKEDEAPAIDRSEAGKQARGLISEIYGLVRRGALDGLQTLLAPELIVAGPRAGDVFENRSDALVAVPPGFKRERHKLTSRGLVVTPGPSGTSAWAIDTVELDGRRYTMGAVLEGADELWTVNVLQLGAAGGAGGGKKSPPKLPAGGATPEAKEVVKLAVAAAEGREVLAEQWLDGPASVFLGGGKSAVRGGKKLRKLFGGKKPGKGLPDFGVLADGERAALTADGEVAWVLGVVESDDGPPRRWFLVYVKVDGAWKLVALHVAAPVG